MINNAVMKIPERGFTLIELIVAIGVFALLSLIAVGSLQNMTRANDTLKQSSNLLSQTQFAVSLFDQDVGQAIPRSIRDQLGGQNPALTGLPNRLSATVSGWQNPTAQQRSDLSRVSYQYQNNSLIRMRWPVLDRTQGTEAEQQNLLENVTRLQFRYLDNNEQWQREWPPTRADSDDLSWPQAVELDMQVEGLGRIVRLISLVAVPDPPAPPVRLGS